MVWIFNSVGNVSMLARAAPLLLLNLSRPDFPAGLAIEITLSVGLDINNPSAASPALVDGIRPSRVRGTKIQDLAE